MEERLRVVLPPKFDLVVGDTFQMFYRGIIEAPNPYNYDIDIICEKGRAFPRYFEYTPQQEGKHKLYFKVYSADKRLLGSGETTLNVCMPKEPKEKVNVLCMGDSILANGEIVFEFKRRLTELGGEIEGLGFSNINFIGSCNKGDCCYEAHGGWKWDHYISKKGTSLYNAKWIKCKHDKTAVDQHSLWQDENGVCYKLETIEKNRLKFIPHKFIKEGAVKGFLRPYSEADNPSPIEILGVEIESNNPFLNPETMEIDFKYYCKKCGVEKIDYVYINLGANHSYEPYNPEEIPHEEYFKGFINKAKIFVDMLHRDFPNAKVKIMGGIIPSYRGGMGTNYSVQFRPVNNAYESARFYFSMMKAYQEWSLDENNSDIVEYISIAAQYDTDYNMQSTFKAVNTRNKMTEYFDINGIHPSYEGYMQIADALYRNAIASFCR